MIGKPLCVALLFAGLTISHSVESQARVRSLEFKPRVYAQVVIYDAIPGKERALQSVLTNEAATRRAAQGKLVNDRVLKNLDPLAYQFATYTKFRDWRAANLFLRVRLDQVKGLVRRPPEHHLLALENSYTPKGAIPKPTGADFNFRRTGQIAHLGIFLPKPDYSQEYFDALNEVKKLLVGRRPKGWQGDDLLTYMEPRSPERLAPYTPRPTEATLISVNYGEYDFFENAENAYLNRLNSDDPQLVTLSRIFFGALQVPTRFFIFSVIANY